MFVVRPSRIVAIGIICCFWLTLANCSSVLYGVMNVPSYFGAYDRHAGISYGSEPRQRLDVYVPKGAAARPIVVFWYGGMWTRGTKEQYRFVGAALANSGYVAVLPDYRLFPKAKFPQFIEDGAAAVRWAREHATEFGGDPNALFLMGHSAGAHLAASLALDPRYLRKVGGDVSWLRGWIGLSGPYLLDRDFPLIRAIFHEPYVTADWKPIEMVTPRAPPALILHGIDDVLVEPREALDLSEKLLAAGVPVECHIYERTAHGDTVMAFSPMLREEAPTLAATRSFIDQCVQGGRCVQNSDYRRGGCGGIHSDDTVSAASVSAGAGACPTEDFRSVCGAGRRTGRGFEPPLHGPYSATTGDRG